MQHLSFLAETQLSSGLQILDELQRSTECKSKKSLEMLYALQLSSKCNIGDFDRSVILVHMQISSELQHLENLV